MSSAGPRVAVPPVPAVDLCWGRPLLLGLVSAGVTPEHESLLTALVEFVGEAGKRAPELADMADREAADAMANWRQAAEVR